MENTILIALFLIVIIGFGFVIYILNQRLNSLKSDTASTLLKQDITHLSTNIEKLKDGLQAQLTDRLDKNQELMRQSIMKQFSESSKIIADVTQRLTKL